MVKKILLFFDDYVEMQKLQKDLKKIGFDCEGVKNAIALNESLLSFPADAILISGNSNRVNVHDTAVRLAETRSFHGKVIVLLPSQMSNEELLQLRVDALIEENCPFEKLIRVLAHLLNLGANPLVEKWKRNAGDAHTADLNSATTNFGNNTPSAHLKSANLSSAQANRAARFEKALVVPDGFQKTAFDRKKIQKLTSENLFDSKDEALVEKRAFAEKLFKRKP